MGLVIIGIGLSDATDITVKGLETVQDADVVYLETYTSILQCPVKELEAFYKTKIIPADRALVEQKAEETILNDAQTKKVAFLVIGDALSATTHTDLYMRAKKAGIPVTIIHNASVFTAVAETGLQVYKFGKTTSLPFPEEKYQPETAYDVIKENKDGGAHTLILLDLRPQENKYMTVQEAIHILLALEAKRKEGVFSEKTEIVCCARLGAKDQRLFYGRVQEALRKDFGKPLHCIIVPGTLHFVEKEFLELISRG